MKIILQTLIFGLFLLGFSITMSAQDEDFGLSCTGFGASAGDPGSIATTDTIWNDGSNKDLMAIDTENIGVEVFTDYAFFILRAPTDECEEETLVGYSLDGTFDFSDDGDGNPYPPGTYYGAGVGYFQANVDSIVNNQSVCTFINGQFPADPSCCRPGVNLIEIIDCLVEAAAQDTPDPNEPATCWTLQEVMNYVAAIDVILTDAYPVCLMRSEYFPIIVGERGVGIQEFDNPTNSIDIYPNPVRNFANIVYQTEESQNLTIEVYDVVGQMVYQEEMYAERGLNQYGLPAADWMSGIYFCRIDNGREVITRRIMIEH